MLKHVLRAAFCAAVFYCSPAVAQSSAPDSSLARLQWEHAVNVYDQYTNANLPLYNGGEYILYNFRSEGNPFFEADSLTEGDVSYYGHYYRQVPMMYDIKRNELVIASYDGMHLLVLHNDQVDSFHLSHHTFIRLFHNDSLPSSPATGFYDLLYNGKIKVWAKRTKEFEQNTSGTVLTMVFRQHNDYYIRKNNAWYPADNKKDILSVLSDKRSQVKKFSRKQKIKFNKKEIDTTIVAVAAYYDQLTR